MKKIIFFILFATTLFATTQSPDITTITSNTQVSDNIEQGEIHHYKISASDGDTVTVLLNGLNDDADLHVRIGAIAKGGTYDCKSTNGGTNADSCSVTLTSDEDVFIRVYGYRSTDYNVKAIVAHNSQNSLNIPDNVNKHETKFYTLTAEAGQTINSKISGLSDDADLYVRIGSKPTGSTYDCKSTNGGTNDDSCSVTLTQDATVHIAVYGYKATPYTLTANGSVSDNVPTLSSGQAVSDSIARDEIKYYKIIAQYGEDITATINNLTADADIYIKKGSKPTSSSYDCKSTNGGTTSDSCSIKVLDNIEVYIGVSGFRVAQYTLIATATEQIPANPQIPTILEDAEGGTLNPNWVTARGNEPGYIFPTPNIPGAPTGTGVMVHHADANGDSAYRYELPLNNTSQRVLSMDMGGLPDHLFSGWAEKYRGFIPHNSVGVVVETKLGQRIMNWDSWYTHQGYEPRKNDNGHNIFLNYPSPVEMVRGWGYAPTDKWVHFEVNLDTELARLEPNNKIIKIVEFFTTGGYLDNITLSAAE